MRFSVVLLATTAIAGPISDIRDKVKNYWGRDKCILYNDQDCRNFKLDGIEQYMKIGKAGNMDKDLVEDFGGVWYMEGNPLADECLSFANMKWDAKKKSYISRVYEEAVWTWSPVRQGVELYTAVRTLALTYSMTKTNATTYHVKPLLYTPEYMIGTEIEVPEMVAEFDIVRTQDPNLWIRVTKFGGRPVSDYNFTRIVTADGSRTEKYNEVYLPNIGSDQDKITLLPTQFMAQRAY